MMYNLRRNESQSILLKIGSGFSVVKMIMTFTERFSALKDFLTQTTEQNRLIFY